MKTSFTKKLCSRKATKRFSRPNQFGGIVFGFSYYGHDNSLAGIYKYLSKNKTVKQFKTRYYFPDNPRSEEQQYIRHRFISTIYAWQSLTAEEKFSYNKKAKLYNKYGYSYFIRFYLSQLTFTFFGFFGVSYYGLTEYGS